MDNPHDIYLHDTPAWRFFYLSARTLSSGCVRLADAPALALALMKHDQGWNADDIAARLAPAVCTSVVESGQPDEGLHRLFHGVGRSSLMRVVFAPDVYGNGMRAVAAALFDCRRRRCSAQCANRWQSV